MKKSLIALAVAGAVSAPAFAATSNVDIYGIMNIAVQQADCFGAGCSNDVTIVDNTSRIGFKGSEDLGGGLKAIWQIESALGSNGASAIGTSSTGGAAGLGTRNTFIGVAGNFGTALMGRHDTPYKLGTVSLDIFGDTIADYNLGRLNGVEGLMNAHDARSGQALAYISPTWSGFHFAVATVMSNGEPGTALNNAGDDFDAWSATGVYSNGPLFASLSYQKVNADLIAAVAGTQDSDAWKVGVGYTFGDLKGAVMYEDVGVGGIAGSSNRHSWIFNGAYTMGPVVFKAQYADVSNAAFSTVANDDQTAWALGLDYNLSKRTTGYIVYASGDSDATWATVGPVAGSTKGDLSGWNIGMKHSF
jgi:predicted porin